MPSALVSAWCAQCVLGVEIVRCTSHISGRSARMRYSGSSQRQAAADDAVKSGAMQRLHVHSLPRLYSQMGVVSLRNRTLSPTAQRVIHGIETLAAQVNVQPE